MSTGAKIVFLAFRQQTETLQGVLVISGDKDENKVSKQMLKYAQGITVSRRRSITCKVKGERVVPGRARLLRARQA